MLEITFHIRWSTWLIGFEIIGTRLFREFDIYLGPFSWRITYE